jgi:AcrR family transcriptional regulator
MARPPSESARTALLATAAELLAEGGIAALTADEVSHRSGIAKTTLYRHFGSVDGLVFALIGSRVRTTRAPNSGSLVGDLRKIQRAYLDQFNDPLSRELFVWMVTKAMQSPETAEQFAAARIQPTGPTMVALEQAIKRGELREDTNLELALHVIQGAFISSRVIGNRTLTRREFDQILAMIVHGLQGDQHEASR